MFRVFLGAVLCVTAFLTVAAQEKKDDKKPDYAKLIVGKWDYVSGDAGFGGFKTHNEFTKDGKVLRKEGDKWRELGTYKFVGNDLVVSRGGFEATYKIASISEEKLISTDPKGELKRVKGK